MAPADQETQVAENVAWRAARNYECLSDLLSPSCPFVFKKCVCDYTELHSSYIYVLLDLWIPSTWIFNQTTGCLNSED